jgi:cell wall-associated NlpC family hydrolase
LVRNVLAQYGVITARDAAQQFMWGRLVATRWHRSGIQAGDLLYFINPSGRIYHVGIALSPTHFLHAGVPEVKINSLDPTDRLYCAARDEAFLAARRF